MFRKVSQISIHYKNSSLSKEEADISFKKTATMLGERLPYLASSDTIMGTENFTQGTKFHLVIFPGIKYKNDVQKNFQRLIKNYEVLIVLDEVLFNDKTKKLYQLSGI